MAILAVWIALPSPARAVRAETCDPQRNANEWVDEGYRRKDAGDLAGSAVAFEAGRACGFDPQRVDMELGYLALAGGQSAKARAAFESAARGPDASLAHQARAELCQCWFTEASSRRARGDLSGARAALEAAQAAGADPQRSALEMGYLTAASGDAAAASAWYGVALKGPDEGLARQARAELPGGRSVRGDLYADGYGWSRFSGHELNSNLVPTLRIRALWQPWEDLEARLYLFVQGTRDVASNVASGVPRIYADNYLMFGPGLQVRLWRGQLALFIQGGPAVNLLRDGRARTVLDVRGGGNLSVEHPRCALRPVSGAAWVFAPCADVYAEAVWASRFEHDVMAFARGRGGAALLVTGPLAWEVIAEARVAADTNGDYYNNFADGGAGVRWRLLAPFRVDVLATFNAGSYFGRFHLDPAPSPLGYAEARFQAATYLEF